MRRQGTARSPRFVAGATAPLARRVLGLRPLAHHPSRRTVEPIPIAQLEAAINRARNALPASGNEAALSRDVALLAALYGRMIFEGRSTLDLEELEDGEQVVLLQWLAAG